MLILSKKGFDTENGKVPSPILEDGRMVPLPIPEPREGVCASRYCDLSHGNQSYADLLREVGATIPRDAPAHLDPDLIASVRQRPMGWRGMFGQVDQAESHLSGKSVGSGSLFLFWGWYQFSRPRSEQAFSAIFGYLEVVEAMWVGDSSIPPYAHGHPHLDSRYPRENNRIYFARKTLSWNPDKPGWGVFKYHDGLRLSVPGAKRSLWKLPPCFHPSCGCNVTYLAPKRWKRESTYATVELPGRGQEFVCTPTAEVMAWARELIDNTEVWTASDASQHDGSTFHVTQASAEALPPLVTPASARSVAPPLVARPRVTSPNRNTIPTMKPVLSPMPGERVVSFGDRLLWHQLGLQMNGHRGAMLTEDEFVEIMRSHFPDASVQNLRMYRSYFNSRHKSMGFRENATMPVPVEFAKDSLRAG